MLLVSEDSSDLLSPAKNAPFYQADSTKMAANARAAKSSTDDFSPTVLSHSSPTGHELGDDTMERRLTRSEEVSSSISAERRELMAAAPVRPPSGGSGVRMYGSVNHQEYGMGQLASWYADGNNVGTESGRHSSTRLSSRYDDEFSIVSGDMLRSGETSEASLLGTYVQIPVTEALELCTKSVLKPYNMFLKTVGWRKFRSRSEDLHEHSSRRVLNVVYLIFIIVLIIVVSMVQVLVCLRRDAVDTIKHNSSSCNSNTSVCTECLKHSVTSFLIPDLLLFASYIYALYIFRFSEPEYLQMLTQTVFLGQASNAGIPRQKRLICTLRLQLLLGILWLLLSFFTSVYRIVARETAQARVPPLWNSLPDVGRYILEAFCVLGFVIFDMVYLSIVVNYSFQCQLLIYYVQSIKDRVLTHDWPGIGLEQSGPAYGIDSILEKAMKEMDQLKIFVLHLNHHISWAVSILMFIFVISVMDAFLTLLRLSEKKQAHVELLFSGMFSLAQWVSISVFPVVQAARLNASCHSLRTLGHVVRSRPLTYTRMSYLHLDSFLSYTASQQLSVKLLLIRVTPGIVCGVAFVIACVLVYLLQHDVFQWAEFL